MIHHVKQKLWLNLNANVVDAIVHFNVKATAVRLCRLVELALLRDKQARWGRGRLLCRRASCQVHFSHLFLPSFTSDTSFHCLAAFPSPGVSLSLSRLATCLQLSRHCAAEEPQLVRCSGLLRQIQRCSRSPSAQYDCLNRTSVSCLPSDYFAM